MTQRPNAALLFAAGFGTRMRPLTNTRPKPLIEVAGKTLLDHALDQVRPMKLARIAVNTHYHHQQIVDHLEGQDIAVSHETPDILETGGGLKNALPLLGRGAVYTMNTDAVWKGPNPLAILAEAWDPDRMDALLLCVPKDRAMGHGGEGDFAIDRYHRLTRPGPDIYSGVQIIKPDGLHEITEQAFSLNVLWNRMAEAGRLAGVHYPGHWCDVGHPGGIALAEGLLADV